MSMNYKDNEKEHNFLANLKLQIKNIFDSKKNIYFKKTPNFKRDNFVDQQEPYVELDNKTWLLKY